MRLRRSSALALAMTALSGFLSVMSTARAASPGSADGQRLWSKRMGGSVYSRALGVATDPSGNVFLAGDSATPSINLGGSPLSGEGADDIVIAAYSVSGTHLWSRRLGGPGDDIAWSVASDPSGDVVIAGQTDSPSIDLGGGPLPAAGGKDMVVAKYSAEGMHLWSKRLGGTGDDVAWSVASDPSGNILLAGESARVGDMVVTKYTASGTHLWSKRIWGGAAYAVASDPLGNVLLAGTSQAYSIDLGGGPLAGSPDDNYRDMVLGKFTPSGAHIWSKRLGGGSEDIAGSVASDADGNVLVSGTSTSRSIDLGGGPHYGDSFDMVFGKFSASGAHVWSKRYGGTYVDFAASIASDPSGNVLVAGASWSDSINLGGPTYPSAGLYDIVIGMYSPSGAHLWSKRMGGGSIDEGYSVASDPWGNVLLAGEAGSSSIDLGGGPHDGRSTDMVVVKYPPDRTPPISTFKPLVGSPPVVSDAGGISLTGTVTDNLTGVESLTVTYTAPVSNAQVTVEASLDCNDSRRSCTFTARGPGSSGVWTATARATDRAGNLEPRGQGRTVLAIP